METWERVVMSWLQGDSGNTVGAVGEAVGEDKDNTAKIVSLYPIKDGNLGE